MREQPTALAHLHGDEYVAAEHPSRVGPHPQPGTAQMPARASSSLLERCLSRGEGELPSVGRTCLQTQPHLPAVEDHGTSLVQSRTIPGLWVAATQIPALGKALWSVHFISLVTHSDEPHF